MRLIRHFGYKLESLLLNRHVNWGFLAALGMAVLVAGTPVHATRISERAKQKHAAETERAELQQKLTTLKRDIHRTDAAKSHAADALAHSEAALSEANRTLHELAGEQREIEEKIARLSEEQDRLCKRID